MKTKAELSVDLKALQLHHSRAVKSAEMTEIFGVILSLAVVKAWLKEVSLSGIEVTEGDGTTYVFKRTS